MSRQNSKSRSGDRTRLKRSVERCDERQQKNALQRTLEDGKIAALEDRAKIYARLVDADRTLRAKQRQIDKTTTDAALNEALVLQTQVKTLRYGVEYSGAK